MNEIIELLIKLSMKAFNKNEIPVAAIITDKNNHIIAKSYNNRQRCHRVTGHAEINCILKAEKKIKDWRLNEYIMYVTLEPCDMCYEIIKESRLDKVYYLVQQNKTKRKNIIQIDQYEKEKNVCRELIQNFLKKKRNND